MVFDTGANPIELYLMNLEFRAYRRCPHNSQCGRPERVFSAS